MTQELEQRFLTARKTYIKKCFSHMNPMQLEAVLTTQGPLLLLAGAGSGKTTVLINRIANLIRFGCAADSDELPPEVSQEDVLFLEQEISAPREENRARAGAQCTPRRHGPLLPSPLQTRRPMS